MEHTDAVRAVLQTFAQAQDDYRNLPRDDESLIARHNRLLVELNDILDRVPQLHLAIGPEDISVGGTEVYRDSGENSMPRQLHQNGIRELLLVAGIPSWELATFIDALNTDLTESIDDDLVTLLWERDLSHIRCQSEVAPPGASWRGDPVGPLADYLATRRELPSTQKYTNIRLLEARREPLDPRLQIEAVTLSEGDRGMLREMDRNDRERDLAIDVLNVLLHTLEEGGASEEHILQIISNAASDHENPGVRAAAIHHAARFEAAPMEEMVTRGLRDEAWEVRRAACEIAPDHRTTRVILTLASLLRDDEFPSWDPENKVASAVAYGRTALEDSLVVLEELLRSRADSDREAGARGLAATGLAEAEQTLAQAASDDPSLQPLVNRVLSNRGAPYS